MSSILEATGPVTTVVIAGAADIGVATPGIAWRVLAADLNAAADAVPTFTSGTTPTVVYGVMQIAAKGQKVLGFNPCGWCQSKAGEKLSITGAVTGQVVLQQVRSH